MAVKIGTRNTGPVARELRAFVKSIGGPSDRTTENRMSRMTTIANDLAACGYARFHPDSLGMRHVEALVERWNEKIEKGEISPGTAQLYVGDLRYLAAHTKKDGMIPASNRELGLHAERARIPDVDKAQRLTPEMIDRMKFEHVRAAMKLAEACGLRKAEAAKMRVSESWNKKEGTLHITKGVKGGDHPRTITVTDAMKPALQEAARLSATTPEGSLIPGASYKDFLKDMKADCARVGLSPHGLRHAWAQDRYNALVASLAREKGMDPWKAKHQGGPAYKDLTAAQKVIDAHAREKLSEDLGHHRVDVTFQYTGK